MMVMMVMALVAALSFVFEILILRLDSIYTVLNFLLFTALFMIDLVYGRQSVMIDDSLKIDYGMKGKEGKGMD